MAGSTPKGLFPQPTLQSGTPEAVLSNFTLASSQLASLVGEYRDVGKKAVDSINRVESAETRLASLEAKMSGAHTLTLPNNLATTADLGKALESSKKEIDDLRKQLVSMQEDIKLLHSDRSAMLTELFNTGNHLDTLQSALQSSVPLLIRGVIKLATEFATAISSVPSREVQKK